MNASTRSAIRDVHLGGVGGELAAIGPELAQQTFVFLLAWYLSQYYFLRKEVLRRALDDTLAELVGNAIELMPNLRSGLELKQWTLNFKTNWSESPCEWYAEELALAWRALRDDVESIRMQDLNRPAGTGPDPDIDAFSIKQAFDTIIGCVHAARRDIDRKLEETIGPFPEVWHSLFLGQRVDEVLRPPEVYLHLFRRQENPRVHASTVNVLDAQGLMAIRYYM